MQAVARPLIGPVPCQETPTHVIGKKPGFCKLLLPEPRHIGDSVPPIENDDDSPPPLPSAVPPPELLLSDARYVAIGPRTSDGISAPSLPAIRSTVVRQPDRDFDFCNDR